MHKWKSKPLFSKSTRKTPQTYAQHYPFGNHKESERKSTRSFSGLDFPMRSVYTFRQKIEYIRRESLAGLLATQKDEHHAISTGMYSLWSVLVHALCALAGQLRAPAPDYFCRRGGPPGFARARNCARCL